MREISTKSAIILILVLFVAGVGVSSLLYDLRDSIPELFIPWQIKVAFAVAVFILALFLYSNHRFEPFLWFKGLIVILIFWILLALGNGLIFFFFFNRSELFLFESFRNALFDYTPTFVFQVILSPALAFPILIHSLGHEEEKKLLEKEEEETESPKRTVESPPPAEFFTHEAISETEEDETDLWSSEPNIEDIGLFDKFLSEVEEGVSGEESEIDTGGLTSINAGLAEGLEEKGGETLDELLKISKSQTEESEEAGESEEPELDIVEEEKETATEEIEPKIIPKPIVEKPEIEEITESAEELVEDIVTERGQGHETMETMETGESVVEEPIVEEELEPEIEDIGGMADIEKLIEPGIEETEEKPETPVIEKVSGDETEKPEQPEEKKVEEEPQPEPEEAEEKIPPEKVEQKEEEKETEETAEINKPHRKKREEPEIETVSDFKEDLIEDYEDLPDDLDPDLGELLEDLGVEIEEKAEPAGDEEEGKKPGRKKIDEEGIAEIVSELDGLGKPEEKAPGKEKKEKGEFTEDELRKAMEESEKKEEEKQPEMPPAEAMNLASDPADKIEISVRKIISYNAGSESGAVLDKLIRKGSDHNLKIPLRMIIDQLPSGKVEVTVDFIYNMVPIELVNFIAAQQGPNIMELKVQLPMEDIAPQVDPSLLKSGGEDESESSWIDSGNDDLPSFG